MRTESLKWVYEHLLCEYNHWDICLTGVVVEDGRKLWCIATDDRPRFDEDEDEVSFGHVRYEIHDVGWDAECDEWMEDYRKGYNHWFYVDGVRQASDGGSPGDFSEKWKMDPPPARRIRSCEPPAETA